MPLIERSSYKSPFWLRNPHLATIYPSLFRKVEGVSYERERIDTWDNDFMDLDWVKKGSKSLLLLAHGLEGGSHRHYMLGPAKYFSDRDWDVVSWNCRTCSGEMNKQLRMYHHAATDDLAAVVNHIVNKKEYSKIVLAGFSMGGSLIIKYLGEGQHVPKEIFKSVVFSVPCDLKDSALTLSRKGRGFYRKKFLGKLKEKISEKAKMYPKKISVEGIEQIVHFPQFDEKYTAPLHGFDSADDFYHKASAKNYLEGIEQPTLIVNALNDPFFTEASYPFKEVDKLDKVFLETPKRGGHVGFMLNSKSSWMEQRIWNFIHTD